MLNNFVSSRSTYSCTQRRLIDKPNSRSSHSIPTPRGGGLVFFIISAVSSIAQVLAGQVSSVEFLPLICTPLAIVGLLDDRQNLPAFFRYLAQLLTAAFILGISPLVLSFGFAVNSSIFVLLFCLVFLLIAVTAVINFTNFMDGLDGLVAGCML